MLPSFVYYILCLVVTKVIYDKIKVLHKGYE